jgi:hypothetical protein
LRERIYLYDANGNRTAVERRIAANDTIAAQTDSYTRTAGTNRLASIVIFGDTIQININSNFISTAYCNAIDLSHHQNVSRLGVSFVSFELR